jgi:hypothetical protein
VSAARIPFPNGSLSLAELTGAFSALQADVTFIDAENVVRYFSDYRIFSRPATCLNRDVLECHPAATRPGIERMISEFATGWRDEAVFLAHKDGRVVDVRYLAVRDQAGSYLGCLEVATWATS